MALAVEVHDDLPNLALVSVSLLNGSARDISLDQVDIDRHRLNAGLMDAKSAPNQMWSFHGASIQWGKDNVFPIPKKFSQQNQMGSMVEVRGDLGRVGGGIPVVAFWTRQRGRSHRTRRDSSAGALDSRANESRWARGRHRAHRTGEAR